jgi:putative Mn2+ efflux pump MntP
MRLCRGIFPRRRFFVLGIADVLLLALGLSADAFAVSICKGLSVQKLKPSHALICGVYFGGFQALMPLIGYYLGASFSDLISSVTHWIAFALLLLIGGNMIREAVWGDDDDCSPDFSPAAMLPMAIATSIDALAVGVAISMSADENSMGIFSQIAIIGIITLVLSAVGVYIGHAFGKKFKKSAEILGGSILIILGVKILLEGLGIIG